MAVVINSITVTWDVHTHLNSPSPCCSCLVAATWTDPTVVNLSGTGACGAQVRACALSPTATPQTNATLEAALTAQIQALLPPGVNPKLIPAIVRTVSAAYPPGS